MNSKSLEFKETNQENIKTIIKKIAKHQTQHMSQIRSFNRMKLKHQISCLPIVRRKTSEILLSFKLLIMYDSIANFKIS
jgi:hypothetical protein